MSKAQVATCENQAAKVSKSSIQLQLRIVIQLGRQKNAIQRNTCGQSKVIRGYSSLIR